jgi:hypothetical protein
MKNFIVTAALLLSASIGFGQCDQDVVITSSKTEYLDASGVVTRSEDEQSTIEITRTKITITPGNAAHKMIGNVQSTTCEWSKAFQEGKMVIKAVFDDPAGAQRNATLTTEGQAGIITFLMEIAEMPDKKIRVHVTSFKESKQN